jgi:hypothetical protein
MKLNTKRAFTLIQLVVTIAIIGIAQAKDEPAEVSKVFVTVTNKSDLKLSLTLTRVLTHPVPRVPDSLSNPLPSRKIPVLPLRLAPIPKGVTSGTSPIPKTRDLTTLPPLRVVPPPPTPVQSPLAYPLPSMKISQTGLRVREIVMPQQQTILEISKGDYIVEATTMPQPPGATGARAIRITQLSTFRATDFISANEVWSFELDSGPKPSGLPESAETVRQIPMSHTWRRDVQPARQPKPQGPLGLSQTPERRSRLAPSEQPTIEPLRQIPARALKLNPMAPGVQPSFESLRQIPERDLKLPPTRETP